MLIELPYGSGSVRLELPDESVYFVIGRDGLPRIPDLRGEVRMALRDPIGSRPISSLVKGGMKILIVGDDISRPTPQASLIPPILDELNSAGVPDEDIEILIGLGTHRPMSDREIIDRYGSEVVERVDIYNHDYADPDGLVMMGETGSGIPVSVNKRLTDADFVICVGNIVPHLTAGWGGGGKGIQPGVCGEETTGMTHAMAAKMYARGKRLAGDPDNEMRREIEAVAVKAGLKMILNTVLNERGEVSAIVAGDPIEAHREGVRRAMKSYCPEIPGLADIVVVACSPADIDYWQGIKPLSYAMEAVKPGGTVVMIAEFPEGISPTHPAAREMGGWRAREIEGAMDRGEVPQSDLIAASAMLVHAKMMERAEVICYSDGMAEADKDALGMIHVSCIEEAMELAFRSQGRDAKVGVLKCGDILPVLKNG